MPAVVYGGTDDVRLQKKMRICILILNFNGADLLEKYLPSFLSAARRSRHECRVGVIDNASADSSVEILKKNFQEATVYAQPDNRVLCAYNDVAAKIDDDILIFMNNDIRAEEDFVDGLIEPFLKDPNVFFVTPKVLGPTGAYEGNKTRGFVRLGVFGSTALYPGFEAESAKPGTTFQGGFGAVDRKKFLELGGYDDLYLPGRLEDADLCFRAHRRGWKCLYEPSSVVHHEGGVSFHRVFGSRRTLVINWRNTFLFMWKNFSDKLLLARCGLGLPARLLWSLIAGRTELIQGYLEALPLKKEALGRGRASRSAGPAVLNDLEILRR